MSNIQAFIRRSPVLAALAAAAILLIALPAGAGANQGGQPAGNGQGKTVDVMTRNLYLGADLTPAIGAGTGEQLVTANGIIFRQVLENNFPLRAEGLADEILQQKPDLVGLQEVAHWETTPISPAGTARDIDYLKLLLDELNAGNGKDGKGKPQYRVVEVQREFGAEAPADVNGTPDDGPPIPGFGNDGEVLGKLTMRDVILARNGAGVQTWNEEGANFEHLLELPVGGQIVPILRGWTATDAKVRGSHAFHFVNTHLEAFHPGIRLQQAEELVAPGGPATSNLPVILVGDLNSDDDTVTGADTLAYDYLLSKGLVERSTNDPLSCCLETALLEVGKGGAESQFDHQVDHVMTDSPALVKLKSSTVTGRQPVNGFWDSDHAGLFSSLNVK